MIPSSLTEVFQWKERLLKELEDSVQERTEEQLATNPGPGRWSIAQILEHVSLVDARLVRMIEVYLQKANPLKGGPVMIGMPQVMLDAAYQKLPARPDAIPTGKIKAAESLARLKTLDGTFQSMRTRMLNADLTSVSVPHPFFGPLTLDQWALFLCFHEERHLRQMMAINAELF